jgi:hypothetical protein
LPGGYMHGYISTQYCQPPTPSVPATVTGTEVPVEGTDLPVFALYPNPANTSVTVELRSGMDTVETALVEIYDMRGRKVLTVGRISLPKEVIRVDDLPNGLYFVRIMAGKQTETIKLIVQR